MEAAQPTKPHARTAAASYAEHAAATQTLLRDALERISANAALASSRHITWADAGDASRLHALAVHLAWAAGVITAQEAKDDHGVPV